MRIITWLILLVSILSGCASLPGSSGGPTTQISRPVCFSGSEIGEILTKIEKLRSAVAACKRGAQHDSEKAQISCDALVSRWQIEARSCQTKLETCSAKKCPTCWLPWVLVGFSVAITISAISILGYREMTRGVSP